MANKDFNQLFKDAVPSSLKSKLIEEVKNDKTAKAKFYLIKTIVSSCKALGLLDDALAGILSDKNAFEILGVLAEIIEDELRSEQNHQTS